MDRVKLRLQKLVQVKMGLSISRSTLTEILRNETKLSESRSAARSQETAAC